jgi:MFS family permease
MARTEGGDDFVSPVPSAVPPPTPPGAGEPERIGVIAILSDPAVRIIILVVFVVILGFGLILPILPLYAKSFGVGTAAASLLISSFAAARLLFDLFAGPIVDRFGERLTATAGLIVVSASALGAGLAPNYPLLVVLRSAGGSGS